jgi:hypothetical protein
MYGRTICDVRALVVASLAGVLALACAGPASSPAGPGAPAVPAAEPAAADTEELAIEVEGLI